MPGALLGALFAAVLARHSLFAGHFALFSSPSPNSVPLTAKYQPLEDAFDFSVVWSVSLFGGALEKSHDTLTLFRRCLFLVRILVRIGFLLGLFGLLLRKKD